MAKINLTERNWALNGVAFGVFITGFITLASVLLEQTRFKRIYVAPTDAHLTVLASLSLIYLATLLRRGKRNAWAIAVPLYFYIVARNLWHLFDLPSHRGHLPDIILNIVIPLLAFCGLIYYRRLFQIKSELRNFQPAGKRAVLILLIAFLYGVVGFQLLDERDFHQEISISSGAHYTIDQFGLTTNKQINPYTKRANIFLDSLAVVSLGSLFYVGASLFAPIRFRLSNQRLEHAIMTNLLEKYPSTSEGFFKLWPHDKAYFFTADYSCGLAYHVSGGTALVVSDPAGSPGGFKQLLNEFKQYCATNDWSVALIHVTPAYAGLYKDLGYEVQKIGEEALVNVPHFVKSVARNKYFRNINNRFESKGYTCEVLLPPHNEAVILRLHDISNDWLKRGGRAERGFMMGYFSEEYMQACPIMVARDAAGTIQAFINQLPTANKQEANFDLLRHTKNSLGNINDYLMTNFIIYLLEQGFDKLNMGLAPLSGLKSDNNSGVVDNVFNFVYANSGRFYSFQGLQRFKAKYEPEWEDRFIVYQNGIAGLTKTLTALLRAMRVPKHRLRH